MWEQGTETGKKQKKRINGRREKRTEELMNSEEMVLESILVQEGKEMKSGSLNCYKLKQVPVLGERKKGREKKEWEEEMERKDTSKSLFIPFFASLCRHHNQHLSYFFLSLPLCSLPTKSWLRDQSRWSQKESLLPKTEHNDFHVTWNIVFSIPTFFHPFSPPFLSSLFSIFSHNLFLYALLYFFPSFHFAIGSHFSDLLMHL